MRIIQHILFLTLFLMAITFIAFVGSSHAASCVKQPPIETVHSHPGIAQAHVYKWSPEDWGTGSDESNNAILKKFYNSGLITAQYVDKKGLPILEVSDMFLRLSDQDKERVSATIAEISGLTTQRNQGSFSIKHKRTGATIGHYSPVGLTLR